MKALRPFATDFPKRPTAVNPVYSQEDKAAEQGLWGKKGHGFCIRVWPEREK